MRWAPESATAAGEPEDEARSGEALDVRALLRALPDPPLPAGLESRVRARLLGRTTTAH